MDNAKDSPEPKPPDKFSGLIPQLYYDIIARIIPGCTLLLVVFWDSTTLKEAGFASVFVFVGAGYLVGMLLKVIGLLFDLLWMVLAKWTFLRRRLLTPRQVLDLIDSVEAKNASAGNRLFKMYAEVAMHENLLAAVIILRWRWPPIFGAMQLSEHPEAECLLILLLFLGLAHRVIAVSERARHWSSLVQEPRVLV